MTENNFQRNYLLEKSTPVSLTYNENEFSTSRYLFCLAYLEGHKKLGKEKPFPKINPTSEDYSRLVKTLREAGLKF